MNKLRESCLNEDNSINKTMQKFVFDLGTVKEIIRIVLANRITISSTYLPTDANDYMDEKLLQLKIESFRLLKVRNKDVEVSEIADNRNQISWRNNKYAENDPKSDDLVTRR